MADFAPPFGLLEAQQSAAAQIPYRNSQMALQGAEHAADQVVNAFFTAADLNRKRQQLEETLMKTQFEMSNKEQLHQMQMERLQFDEGYKVQNMQRLAEQYQNTAEFKDRQMQFNQDKYNWGLARQDAKTEDASKFRNKLTSIAMDPSSPLGSAAWQQKALAAKTEFGYSKETENVWNDFAKDADRQARQQNKDADLLFKSLNTSLTHGAKPGSEGFTFQDLNRADSDWRSGKDAQGNPTKFIVEKKVVDPQTKTFKYQTVSKQEEDALIAKKQAGQLRYRTTDASNYDTWKEAHKRVMELGSGKLGIQPAATISSEVTRNVGNRKAVFDSNTKQFLRWADE